MTQIQRITGVQLSGAAATPAPIETPSPRGAGVATAPGTAPMSHSSI